MGVHLRALCVLSRGAVCPCCGRRTASALRKPRRRARRRPRATARKLNRPTISACRKQFSAALTHDLHPEQQRQHEKTRRSARNRQVQQPGWLHRSPRHRVRPDERSPPATPSTLFSGSAGTTLHPSVVSMTRGPVKSAEPWGLGCSSPPLPRAVVSCLGVERR